MDRLNIKKCIVILFLSLSFGKLKQYEPYISPGIQIGYASNKQFFYGFQASLGFSTSPKGYIYSPSLCFGTKRYFKSKSNEKYFDLQIMSLPDGRVVDLSLPFGIPVGIGFGKSYQYGKDDYRIKVYSWWVTNFTLDFTYKKKEFTGAIIPVLPISAVM